MASCTRRALTTEAWRCKPFTVFRAPITAAADADAALAAEGFVVLDAAGICRIADAPPAALQAWLPCWDRLPADTYLRDGGHYRQRRHACFIAEDGHLHTVPQRAHWQPLDYNALHGGIERWFEPIEPVMSASPAWAGLLLGLAKRASALRAPQTWFIEAHPFRIHTEDGIGRPTPEGAHRDGVDLVAVLLVARRHIKGGETRVFDADGPKGTRFTLDEPFSALLLDDARVIHESTPIQPLHADRIGIRDTLVITFRAGGFQGPR
jgi:hypothetical protein